MTEKKINSPDLENEANKDQASVKERSFEPVSVEEFSRLITNLTAEDESLRQKAEDALTEALNLGLSDFAVFDRLISKIIADKREGQFFAFADASARIDSPYLSIINGLKKAINEGNFEGKSKRRRRGKLENQSAPALEKLPFKSMVENLSNFCLAAANIENGQQQTAAVQLYESLTIDNSNPEFNIHDAVQFVSKYHPDQDLRDQAFYAGETLVSLETLVGEDASSEAAMEKMKRLFTEDQGQYQKMVSTMAYSQTKTSILRVVFERFVEANDDYQSFLEQVNNAGVLSRKVMGDRKLPAFNERLDPFGDLANACLALTLKFELKNIREGGDFDGVVLPADRMGAILLTWKNDITREEVQPYIDGEKKSVELADKVRHASYELPKMLELSNEPLRVSELAAVLAFLRPEEELDQKSDLEEFKKEAQGGMYPISRRGVSIRLSERQGNEDLLLKTGLSKITFKRFAGPNELEVRLRFGKRNFGFRIDESLESKGLEELPAAEKAWLERVVYQYLIALKNRDLHQVEKLATESQLEEAVEDGSSEEVVAEKQERKEITKASHLYVLPYSHRPHGWDDPNSEINLEVKKEIGFSLFELNQHFVLAQQDKNYLDQLDNESLRQIILSSLKRLEGKVEPANWKKERVEEIKGTIKSAFLGEKPERKVDLSEMDNVALIGFKHEPENPVGQPIQLKLPSASLDLFITETE